MRSIMVGVDSSAGAQRALDWALAHAAAHDAPIQVVHAWEPMSPMGVAMAVGDYPSLDSVDDVARRAEEATREWVDAARERAPAGRRVTVDVRAVQGSPAPVLLEAARDAGLLVVGARGSGVLARMLLGSVSSAVLHHAHCPVVTVPRDDQRQVRQVRPGGPVVVGVDGSPASLSALRWAAAQARARGATLNPVLAWQVLSVPMVAMAPGGWEPPWNEAEASARRVLEQAVVDALGEAAADDPAVRPELVQGPTAQGLLGAADDAGLLVVGSRGHGGFTGLLLGSVSSQIGQHAPCPVAVVREGEERLD